MKSIKLAVTGIVFLAVTGYGIYGCSNEPNYVISKLDIPREFNKVGSLHNEGLEFIFEIIKEQAIEIRRLIEAKETSTNGPDFVDRTKPSGNDDLRQGDALPP